VVVVYQDLEVIVCLVFELSEARVAEEATIEECIFFVDVLNQTSFQVVDHTSLNQRGVLLV
jgi:hypothetical protein